MYILVAGGGMVGGSLIHSLLENKHDVILVDSDKETCDKLYAETGVVAINGSSTRVDVLKDAGAEKAEVAVITTPNDADNLATAILARSLGVPQIIVRMRDPNYEKAYEVAGVNRVVRVTDLMVNQMMIEIEHPEVRQITTIGGGRANMFVVVVPKGGQVVGKSIVDITRDTDFPADCVFVALYNHDKEQFLIPRGTQILDEGDEVFLITTAANITKVTDSLTAVVHGSGPPVA